jgi:protein-S-isoprenylcysteine O-methyltransferase Ste14
VIGRLHTVIDGAWLVLVVVWLLGSLSNKPAAQVQSALSRFLQAIPLIVALFLLFDPATAVGPLAWKLVPASPTWLYTGAVLTVAGILIALWARIVLGRNWSAMVSVRREHRLARSGPYRLVRHPIYSGLLLALFGTAIYKRQLSGLLAVALALVAWKVKSLQEESFMLEEFGGEYARYSQEVKGLIPFVW